VLYARAHKKSLTQLRHEGAEMSAAVGREALLKNRVLLIIPWSASGTHWQTGERVVLGSRPRHRPSWPELGLESREESAKAYPS
jgi:hypothetical protein